jgi:CubicO group peptidase (beta-lactamase class C family)
MAFYKILGVGIAVIDEYALVWAKGYGVLEAGGPATATTETLFEAASTTKLLVAATALHFVERGLLDLDTDVNAYLKSWKIDDNGFTQEQKVTLRLLLTHQSGLPMTNMAHDESAEPPTLIQVLNGEPPAMNSPAVVEFVPGMKWQYSNIGYVVIQQLLEDTADKPLAQIMHEIIFGPLGMQSSTLEYPLPVDLQTKEIMPHDADGQAHEPAMHPTALAQGGLMTTPSDLARFTIELMRAYQGESDLVLSQDMIREMFRPELELDPSILGMPISGGLGVFLSGTGETLSFLHPGDNWPGASCWLVGFPELGKGAVIMTNGAKGNLLAMEVIAAIAKEYGWPTDR